MDLARWPQADALLDEALSLPPAERGAFVARATEGNPELQRGLEAVMAEAELTDAFLAPGGALSGPLFEDLGRSVGRDPSSRRLAPGMSLGPYRIVDLLGHGGMGEVYRARDSKLGREVALKILPERFARQPERLARFEREARVLASLSHPRIGVIHDVEDSDGLRALVLELVEGPTLAERLAGGPLPIDQARDVARQVAEALEAAHQRAVVHRDLKPANIKLTPDGVKVLDFGLAKALRPDDTGEIDPLTTGEVRPGAIMGTAAYMSPEQARGLRIDHRTDIWAFGCVLYEMLTGERAFGGESSTEILARVLERDPDLARLPAATPLAMRRLVRRCLEKDPRRRLGWIGDALLELDELDEPAPPPEPGVRQLWRWAAGALALVAAVAAGWFLARARPAPTAPVVMRLAVPVPAADELVAGDLPTLGLSRDGRLLVYRARRGGTMRLFRRALDRGEPEAIAGTEHAMAPFVSPDGQWVGFNRDGVLLKAPLQGGPSVVLCQAPGAVSAAWGPDDTIVFGGESTRGLQAVRASGGTPTPLTRPESGNDEYHVLPDVLPDGRGVLLTVSSGGQSQVALADRQSGAERRLTEGRQARFLPPDLLVFMRQNALWVARFDADAGRLIGDPVPTAEDVEASVVSGNAHFAVAESGALVYLPRRAERSRDRSLVWIDRNGRAASIDLEPRAFTRASVSPDGIRLAMGTSAADSRDIWVYAGDRGTLTRLTFDAAVDTAPVWTPDGRAIVFRSDRDGGGLFRVNADGAGEPRRITSSGSAIHTPYEVTRDGTIVLFTEFRTYRDQGIGQVRLDAPGGVEWLVDGPFAEVRPALSPDGRWMAYQSDESGRFEVYVRPYPNVNAGRWQVSTSGGTSPHWGRDSRELLYFSDGAVFRVATETTPSFRAGLPQMLFAVDLQADRLGPVFDLSPDAQRFLFIRNAEDAGQPRLPGQFTIVQHWADEVKGRLAPPAAAAQ